MRNLRKLVLLFAGVIAAMAFSSSAASAQTVEVSEEGGGHCGPVVIVDHEAVDPDCAIHAITEPGTTADLFLHNGVSEVPFSQCENEFEAAFDENGHGYIYHQELDPEAGACNREPCDEGERAEDPHQNIEWEAQLNEPGPNTAETETITVTFCLYLHDPDPESEGTTGTPCTVNLDVLTIGHAYEVHTPPHDGAGNGGAPCVNLGGAVELEGHWITTPATPEHPGFEVHHLDDEPL